MPETTPTSVRVAIEDYRYAILTLARRTQREYLHRLGVFASWCEAQEITLESLRQVHLRQFMDTIRQRQLSSSTLHNYALIIKIFLRWCSKEEEYENAISSRLAERLEIPHIEEKVPTIFTKEQLHAILAACETTPVDLRVRNRAIIAVLIDTGIRASEVVNLTLDCVFLDTGDAYLKVHGKGDKWREVPLGKNSLIALRRYITRYRKGTGSRVFLARGSRPLSVRGLQQLVTDLGAAAHVDRVRCSPHTFRHTYAINFLERTGDIYSLMKLMGHSDIKITQVYLRAFQNRQARRAGISLLDDLF